MAEQQMDSFERVKADIERKKEEQREKLKQEQLKQEKEKREKDFNDGLMRLAEQVMAYENRQDDPTYFLLKTFLDLAVEMREMINNLNSISIAMTCLSDAIGFIDNSMRLDDALYDESLSVKYGFFQRLKQRRKQKKVIRNNTARIQSLIANMSMKYDMSASMMDAMRSLGVKIKAKSEKAAAKSKKKSAKRAAANGAPVQQAPSKGDEFLAQLRAKKGGEASDSPAAPAAAAPSSGATGAAGFDGLV